MICFVCGNCILDDDEKLLFGVDGDFIHKKCESKLQKAKDWINNMTDDEFSQYLLGERKE